MRETSGFPRYAAEFEYPAEKTAFIPACSAILAQSGSWTTGIRSISGSAIRFLRSDVFFIKNVPVRIKSAA
jgi:hypothetical protein